MSEPKFYTVFEADSAYLKALGDTNTYFSEFEVRLKTLEALGGKIDDSITSLLEVEKKILETVGGIATTTNDIFELRKEIAKAQGLDVSEDFNIWDVAQQEPPVGPKIFTIRFLNWDGTVLETVEVEEGQTPVYGGTEPTKESDETYNYTFNGWLPEISPANGNVDYVAQFTATEIPQVENFVTFRAEQAGSTINLAQLRSNYTLEYSTDKLTWTEVGTTMTFANLTNVGDEVYVRGKITGNSSGKNMRFGMTGKIAAYGNCNALLDYEDMEAPFKYDLSGYQMFYNCTSLTKAPELPATTLAKECYKEMFYGCTGLTTAPVLPATTLAEGCYNSMFYNCTSLTTAPVLPATTLAPYCYSSMFSYCSALTTAPVLPVTTLAEGCYNSMFQSCSTLTAAPELPATTLAAGCYNSMFKNCSALTTAPELPATYLYESCYSYMFQGCTTLTTAPVLPATTLVNQCYNSMFKSCSKLTTAPELPATTLAPYCYFSMFSYCFELTTAPELPATTLAEGCYKSMFQSCSTLTTAPELPATTLAEGCYNSMFKNCSALTKAPSILPAKTLKDWSYYGMFRNCSKINEITCLAITKSATNCLNEWLLNVSSTGTFYKDPSASWPTSDDGIPSGWTVLDYAG